MTGAIYKGDHTVFKVWAPLLQRMQLQVLSPYETVLEMMKDKEGYFILDLEQAPPGMLYRLIPDNKGSFPDPASQSQPEGVFGPSELIDHHAYHWNDQEWRGLPLKDLIFYELHIGTFTAAGTFQAAIDQLDELVTLGINAVSLMPVAQFSGKRNWGYDGVFPFAVQDSYGGPEALKQFVDVCHQKGMAVFLDVVYNHIGPEGAVLDKFGPYFTDSYKTPWGLALNFDGPYSDGVRRFFIDNAFYWRDYFHMDGLRLDAIHAIRDNSAIPFLEQLQTELKQQHAGRSFYLIAESDLNDSRVVKDTAVGGYGFDALWLDDFHHALQVHLYPEDRRSYADFGSLEQIAKAYKDGFVHSDDYVAFRKKRHGRSSAGIDGAHFVSFIQNHDQVGNRVDGSRLSMSVGFDQLKVAAAVALLAPYLPLLFMGEEYGAQSPFCYFVDHSDEALIEMVRTGRKKDFQSFHWSVEPPDPKAEASFIYSKLNWNDRFHSWHRTLLDWYKALIQLRKSNDIFRCFRKDNVYVKTFGKQGFSMYRRNETGDKHLMFVANPSDAIFMYELPEYLEWREILNSTDLKWQQSTESNTERSGDFIALPHSGVVYLADS